MSLESFEVCLVIQFIAGVKIAIHELLVYFDWLFSAPQGSHRDIIRLFLLLYAYSIL